MRSTDVRAGAMDVIPETPLSHEEIRELDVFLMSDVTPDECMDVVTLDGFLSALAIGPELAPPSVWLPLIWGGENPSSSLRHTPSALSAY
jgi:yecA family protein